MDFELTEDQETIRRAVAELAATFDQEYWLEQVEPLAEPRARLRASEPQGAAR